MSWLFAPLIVLNYYLFEIVFLKYARTSSDIYHRKYSDETSDRKTKFKNIKSSNHQIVKHTSLPVSYEKRFGITIKHVNIGKEKEIYLNNNNTRFTSKIHKPITEDQVIKLIKTTNQLIIKSDKIPNTNSTQHHQHQHIKKMQFFQNNSSCQYNTNQVSQKMVYSRNNTTQFDRNKEDPHIQVALTRHPTYNNMPLETDDRKIHGFLASRLPTQELKKIQDEQLISQYKTQESQYLQNIQPPVYNHHLNILRNFTLVNNITFNKGCNTCCFPIGYKNFRKNICHQIKIGEGGSGTILETYIKCQYHGNRVFAIKKIQSVRLLTKFNKQQILFHPELYFFEYFKENSTFHVIHGFAAYYYKYNLYLVYELIQSDLHDFIHSTQNLNYRNILTISSNILNAINYLHEQKIIHRDIKPENIAIDENLNIKIFDFGYATIQDSKIDKLFTFGTTPTFYIPSYIFNTQFTIYDDIWAFGTILFLLIEKKLPYDDKISYAETNILKIIRDFLNPSFKNPCNVPKQFIDLIKRLLSLQHYHIDKNIKWDYYNEITKFIQNEKVKLLKR
ncbi:Protein kinase [Spraguea lophii 42_110]|uniref:mitogen-activated protein kinase kinase n=1 Tax=Spraguea lophii (strain 42_110) TaxID=1358809 RepID=S7WA02_SPRLO|nr:Protein kinase [Spraguea lophii 42_110]